MALYFFCCLIKTNQPIRYVATAYPLRKLTTARYLPVTTACILKPLPKILFNHCIIKVQSKCQTLTKPRNKFGINFANAEPQSYIAGKTPLVLFALESGNGGFCS